MTVRGFIDKTRHDYIRTVAGFAAFLERSPISATAEDIRRFQIQQSERGMNAPAMNSAVAALRFFFNHTADRPDLARKLIRLRYPRKLPAVLSPDEVARLLAAATCLKHRAALSVAYGAGLRVAEVASLKVGDIDSKRMLIVVERGKGGQGRHALLSADLLALLRAWWQEGRRDGMMLAKLGLRANEVVTLTLDDIDWRSGEMRIHAKGRQQSRMPIPPDVGAAIVAYLRDGRPCQRRSNHPQIGRSNFPHLAAGQSRPYPRGGSMSARSDRSMSTMAWSASAVGVSRRASGRASAQAVYSACKASSTSTASCQR
jgi:site-specific recombinase XerD